LGTGIQTWQIVDGKLQQVDTSLSDAGRTESQDLEAWIASNPSVIGQDLIVIGRQVQTLSGPLDLLAIDRSGNLVVVELKRDKLPREALAQAIDYASDLSDWSIERVSEACTKYTGKNLEECISEGFPEENIENMNINASQRVLLVGFGIESSLERMVNWLSDTYNVDVNAVVLHYVKTASGDELLTRTAVISEEVAEQRTKRGKFKIPMSDEPGSYEEDELRGLVSGYLSQNMISARRIRDVLLPACLEHGVLQRDQLKQEFVKRGEADDITSAGLRMTTISSQLGMEKNDFLRQVVGYSYPNYPWEKDNYFVRDEFKSLVKELLEELGHETD
jgi:hypothetical protein